MSGSEMLRDAHGAHEEVEETEGTIISPIEINEEVEIVGVPECSVTDMFHNLGPPSPVLPPQPLPIVKTTIAERAVDVEMDGVELNWAAELARRDRHWEDRAKDINDQWARRLTTINWDIEDRYRAFEQRWTNLGESLRTHLDDLCQQVERRVKRHFG